MKQWLPVSVAVFLAFGWAMATPTIINNLLRPHAADESTFPAPTAADKGAVMFGTDAGRLYLNTGTVWDPFPLDAGSSGTVSSVSVVTANGVSCSVANPTTTPALTCSLGAITPASVASVGPLTSDVASGSDWAAPTVSGARLRVAPTATSAGAYFDWATISSRTGMFAHTNSGILGDMNIVTTSGSAVFIQTVNSSGNSGFSASSAGVVVAAIGQSGVAAASTVRRTASLQSTAVGNVTTGDDDLMSYTLPASGGRPYGRMLRVVAWGTSANNANAKTLRLKWGTETLLTTALTVSVAGVWKLESSITFISDTVQDFFAEVHETGTGTPTMAVGGATRDEGGAIILKLTGDATATNDIVQEGITVEYL